MKFLRWYVKFTGRANPYIKYLLCYHVGTVSLAFYLNVGLKATWNLNTLFCPLDLDVTNKIGFNYVYIVISLKLIDLLWDIHSCINSKSHCWSWPSWKLNNNRHFLLIIFYIISDAKFGEEKRRFLFNNLEFTVPQVNRPLKDDKKGCPVLNIRLRLSMRPKHGVRHTYIHRIKNSKTSIQTSLKVVYCAPAINQLTFLLYSLSLSLAFFCSILNVVVLYFYHHCKSLHVFLFVTLASRSCEQTSSNRIVKSVPFEFVSGLNGFLMSPFSYHHHTVLLSFIVDAACRCVVCRFAVDPVGRHSKWIFIWPARHSENVARVNRSARTQNGAIMPTAIQTII